MERDSSLVEKDLQRPENFINSPEYRRLNNGGRKPGCVAIPPLVRELIGSAVALGDEKKTVAETFGTTPTTVARTAQGKVGGDKFDPELKDKVEKVKSNRREEVANAALDTLAEILASNITPAVIGTMKPMEQIHAAKNLAEIAERVGEKKSTGAAQQNFIIFRPEVKDESEYPSIDIVSTPVQSDV